MSEHDQPIDPIRRVASEMAAGIAHEFNNMLASMVGLSDLLRTDPRLPPEMVEDADRIYRATLQGADRVRQIQKIAGRARPAASLDAVTLKDLLHQVRASLESPAHCIEVSCDAACAALAEATDLQDVLERLVANAVEAMPEGGRIELRASQQGDRIHLSVSDEGSGIDSTIRERVFEPFFTTHDQRRGRGLGLAIVQGLIAGFSGTVSVGDAVGGARIEIELPAAVGSGSRAESTTRLPSSSAQASGRVLVVDDDDTIRDVLLRMLRLDGHEGIGADCGEAALEEMGRGAFDVVVTDMAMPGMDGLELAREIRARSPETIVVLSSGWSTDQQSQAGELENVALTVGKPVEYEAFARAIKRALKIRRGEAAAI